ncbi:embryo defective 1974 [Hibiscus trionum]|uniref:Embryo defective 1974 n=1 Tax=Hibiscus trionum TaxID=183268 RepID=A0A9W7GWL6_HIBTR|nr:embryo defective 1974 [Hibiscus trionum]
MSLRNRHIRKISSFLSHFPTGYHHQPSRRLLNSVASSSTHLFQQCSGINTRFSERFSVSFRHSTISQQSRFSPSETHLLSFIKSAFDQLQGPNHFWLNRVDESKDFLKDGTILVVAGRFFEKTGRHPGVIFEKVKLLQQRFPSIKVIGFQDRSSVCSADDQSQLIQLTMEEYITFPVLLSNKNFSKLTDEACFILSKDFKNPLVFTEKDLDIAMLNKAFEELSLQCQVNNTAVHNLKSSWSKEAEIIKEPQFCTALQNLLLYFPACISADESGKRLFLSDSNHHRIIIFDGNGKILDCIGSCPGFEDGEFESAKLLRPAASFYHDTDDCLYIVDSENHAIRRADLERRVLETVYPTSSSHKRSTSLWTWIRTKLGFASDADVKFEEQDSRALTCPWHLIKSENNTFLITSRSFENLWVMDLASGVIKEAVKGLPNTLEFCRHFILEKVSLLKMMPDYLLQQQSDANLSREELPYAGLISCVATFENHIIMCDTVGQGVLKLNRESGISSNFQFYNLGMLGLPYWLSFPLESFYAVAAGLSVGQTDHIQQFSLLPGRVDIRLSIYIPKDTEFVEPLHESCIWCQARGAATELSVVESVAGSSEKVGVAQQWYDELDNLAFETPESEQLIEDDNATTDTKSQDERIHIDSVVNTSPGTSEVIIYAALYLKLRRNRAVQDDNNQEQFAARIANILNPKGNERFGGDSCTKLLLKSNRDLRDLIFIKPLHVRIKFNSPNHPKADNSKDIILTDSSINVDVSLN